MQLGPVLVEVNPEQNRWPKADDENGLRNSQLHVIFDNFGFEVFHVQPPNHLDEVEGTRAAM